MDNYRGCNGLGIYSLDSNSFISLSRIDAMTREEFRVFNLDSLKSIFKKWKESKLPIQESLF